MSLFKSAVLLTVAGVSLSLILRWHDRRRLDRVRRDRTGENYDTFRDSFDADNVGEPVLRAVYDCFAHGTAAAAEIAPRRTDLLWEDQGIDYPYELADVMTQLLGTLGTPRTVAPQEVAELHTVGDIALWLDRQTGSGAPPA